MRVKVPISEMMVGTKRGREAKETLLGRVVLVCGGEWRFGEVLGVTLVPSEITERRNPRLGIFDALQSFFDPDPLLLINIESLVARSHV